MNSSGSKSSTTVTVATCSSYSYSSSFCLPFPLSAAPPFNIPLHSSPASVSSSLTGAKLVGVCHKSASRTHQLLRRPFLHQLRSAQLFPQAFVVSIKV